jgi:trans-2,3-dihydro-3-hydroxyanthranilate isomerase
MRLTFVTVDVFTDRQFGGNPLAVVIDAGGLSSRQMQAIAAEFNLAETTFVLPPKQAAHTAQVRIFTPRAEMPFAGHPNVGTAFVLAREGQCHGRPVGGEAMVFEDAAGLVRMELVKQGSAVIGASLAAPQRLAVGDAVAPEVVAQACAIDVADIETSHHQPCIASCGAPFILAELKERRALSSAQPRADVFARHLPRDGATGIHLYVQAADPDRGEGADIHCRMFAPLHGIPEDPATGSANVALIGLLAKLRPETDLHLAKKIAQGVDMGRPSLLEARAEKTAGTVTATYIGGTCVPVMRGVLALA